MMRIFSVLVFVFVTLTPCHVASASASSQPVEASSGSAVADLVKYYPLMGTVNLGNGRIPHKDVRVSLLINSGERRSTVPLKDGSFTLLDVAPGIHILEVAAPGYRFPRLRVEMSARHAGKFRAALVENHRNILPLPLTVHPMGAVQFFEPRPQFFSLATLYRNPMILLMGFSLVMLFVMPKMMENMDEEQKKELQERMANQPSLTDMLSGRTTQDDNDNDNTDDNTDDNTASTSTQKGKKKK
ncbi:ER membrane protein complex subunit 7 [Pseudoscourfieldia marina]